MTSLLVARRRHWRDRKCRNSWHASDGGGVTSFPCQSFAPPRRAPGPWIFRWCRRSYSDLFHGSTALYRQESRRGDFNASDKQIIPCVRTRMRNTRIHGLEHNTHCDVLHPLTLILTSSVPLRHTVSSVSLTPFLPSTSPSLPTTKPPSRPGPDCVLPNTPTQSSPRSHQHWQVRHCPAVLAGCYSPLAVDKSAGGNKEADVVPRGRP